MNRRSLIMVSLVAMTAVTTFSVITFFNCLPMVRLILANRPDNISAVYVLGTLCLCILFGLVMVVNLLRLLWNMKKMEQEHWKQIAKYRQNQAEAERLDAEFREKMRQRDIITDIENRAFFNYITYFKAFWWHEANKSSPDPEILREALIGMMKNYQQLEPEWVREEAKRTLERAKTLYTKFTGNSPPDEEQHPIN